MAQEVIGDPLSRVDGRLKVTGAAKYSGEFPFEGMLYGVLVPARIPAGTVNDIDTAAAKKAPGVAMIITHQNALKIPGFAGEEKDRVKGLKLFNDNIIHFSGQPIALVLADIFERATHAASLIKADYGKADFETNFEKKKSSAMPPKGNKDYLRGEADAYKKAPVMVEAEYILPSEMHNPMELHVTTAYWTADNKVTVHTKSQGVISSQRSVAKAFGLKPEDVQINSRFVGGAFGSSLRTWPHEIAAIQAAKMINRPVKLTLTREQMFTLVGYRPHTVQKIGIGAAADGTLTGITHESFSQSAEYEEFTERSVNVSRFLYACPNVNTIYKIVPLNLGVPAPMRGPGEATGALALECGLDELSYKLNMDPVALRLKNHSDINPEINMPWSSKHLKECYEKGTKSIGWENRKQTPGTNKDGEWLVGYGMAGGAFGAYRSAATAKFTLYADGTLNIKSATSDIGPGTATAMTVIAADKMGIPANKIIFELGNSSFPNAPTQGGSSTVSSVGSAIHDGCMALRAKLNELAGRPADSRENIDYVALLKEKNLPQLEITHESKKPEGDAKFSMHVFSAHFVKVHVHPLTGILKIMKVVAAVDSGTVVNHKTAAGQMIGGAIGGIGMAVMEEAITDDRFGRYINGNLADYHVPVNADIPEIEAIFTDIKDPYTNPIGSKGIGEISLIGVAPAIANAVYNATGKRVREMPITVDKLI